MNIDPKILDYMRKRLAALDIEIPPDVLESSFNWPHETEEQHISMLVNWYELIFSFPLIMKPAVVDMKGRTFDKYIIDEVAHSPNHIDEVTKILDENMGTYITSNDTVERPVSSLYNDKLGEPYIKDNRAQYKDTVYLRMAECVSQLSKDQNTKVGAVLTDSRNITIGYNGFGSTVPDDPDVLSKTKTFPCGLTKYDMVIHAEANAIMHCSARPNGWTLYVTHYPCIDCAKLITGSGITRVVCAGRMTSVPCKRCEQVFNLAGIIFDVI